ncbi:MAG: glycine oxidase ThiO, partial [Chloroflexi bacterium]|nr:glycine oxidase ThiO [Chloroflexota bacterium]
MAQADVLIVGGGVIGCATAYFLGKQGAKATVIEREAVGSAASGVAAGILSPLSESHEGGPFLQLCLEGLRLHKVLSGELPEATGIDTGHRPATVLILALTEEEERALPASIAWRRQPGLGLQWVTGEEAQGIEPRIAPEVRGALLTQGEGQVESYRLTLAYARGAELRGATVRQGQVVGLLHRGRRVHGVRLQGGEEVACERLVLAMGPWTRQAREWLGVPIPVTPLRGQLLRLELPGSPLASILVRGGNYLVPKADGTVIAGTTMEETGFEAKVTAEGGLSIMQGAVALVPSIAEARLVHALAGLRPLSADGLPILGAAPGWEGVYLATGTGRNGVLLSG